MKYLMTIVFFCKECALCDTLIYIKLTFFRPQKKFVGRWE